MDLRIPFLKDSIGAGSALQALTSAVGIAPCGGCQERAAKLDRALRFVGKEEPIPDGWEQRARSGRIVLAQNKESGGWVTWELRDGMLVEGHFVCGTCPNAYLTAWDDYKARTANQWL